MAVGGPFDVDDALDEIEQRRVRSQMARSKVTPGAASTAGALRAAFPHLKPGDVAALARAGHGPADEIAQIAADRRAQVKVKKGFGWHSIGDVVKGATRGTTTALAAPLEGLQTSFRHYAKNIREEGVFEGAVKATFSGSDEAKTTLGIALLEDKKDGGGNLGSGYLPGGQAAKVQAERAREYGTINGHAITPGRLVGSVVVEPGSKPYTLVSGLVDMSVAIGLDPSNAALKGVGASAKVAKTFTPEEAGLINGIRKTVDVDRVAQWLDSPPGRKVVEGIAGDGSFDSIWRRTGKKLDVADVVQLADLKRPEEVRAFLEPLLGVTIREKPTLARYPTTNPIVRRIKDARIWQAMPGDAIDFTDANQAVEQVERFLRNAGIRDPELIAKHTEETARAVTQGAAPDRFAAVTSAAKAVQTVLNDGGLDSAKARSLTTLFGDRVEELVRFNVDDIGQNAYFPGVKVGADNLPAPSPHLLVEALNSKVPLPDARTIRRETSRLAPLLNNPAIDVPLLAMDHLMQKVWKPLVLLRGAWVVRVIGEEQVRMGGAGFSSFANNPLAALALVVSDEGRVGQVLSKVPGVEVGRADIDILGEAFADAARVAPNPTAYEQALYKGKVADPVGKARRIVTRHKVTYNQDAPEYTASWADELMQLRADPIGERLAIGALKAGDRAPNARPGVDGIKDWFFDGTGSTFRSQLAEMGIDVATRPAADAYIDSVAARLRVKTGGLPELLDAVASGTFRGESLRVGDKINPKVVAALESVKHVGPARVKGDLSVGARAGSDAGEKMNSVVNAMFGALMAKPSNYLSRSSVFRQAYWERVTELVPFMDDTARSQVLQSAAEAKLPKKQMARITSLAKDTKPGIVDLENADTVAKGFALEQTRDLLYDLSDRSQLADVLRLISPFQEAYKEVLTRWARIAVENPSVVRRAHQGVQGARGAGWFRPDPTTGEEVFEYPGSGFMSEHLLGVRVPLTGKVAGLSMASSLLPGFGPVVQYPASKIIPNRPEWEAVRNVLTPFGDPATEGGTVESFLPAWMQRFRSAWFRNDPEQDRTFANAVMDTARYLVSTGDYSTETPEEVERLMAAATTKAKGVFVLRGAAQFFAPSAPSPQFLAVDKDGKHLVAQKLIEEFRVFQEEDYETAVDRFIETFGEGALLFMQPKTQGGAPSTDVLDKWTRANPELVERYENTYSFFGPKGGEFSINLYSRQIRSGERTPIKPDEAVALANHRVASAAYRQAREQVEGRTDNEARQWLAGVRQALLDSYPGYEPMPKDMGRTDRIIRELAHAATDPKIRATDAGKGMVVYMGLREQAMAAARGDLGVGGFQKAKSAMYLREWLRSSAAEIAREHPDFAEMWDQVFARELTDDEPEIEPEVV